MDDKKMERRYKIVCLICKKETYAYNYNARYCSDECRKAAKHKRDLAYWAKQREQTKSRREHNIQVGGSREKKTSLAEVAAEARKHGMSYGQYVDYLYQRGKSK